MLVLASTARAKPNPAEMVQTCSQAGFGANAAALGARVWFETSPSLGLDPLEHQGPVATFSSFFLTLQPLHPCFHVANHNVYNPCARVLAFSKHFQVLFVSTLGP